MPRSVWYDYAVSDKANERTQKMANYNHLEAIDQLGFVHERTPTGSSHAGTWFVHGSEFNAAHPTVRVVSDDDSTELHVFDENGVYLYGARFEPATPGSVVSAAVAAALQDGSSF